MDLKNYICEQLSELKDQRKNIIIQRLAYLKYADETKGNNEFKDLYDLLFNFLFDEYGNIRDNKNLYEYIDKLIKDNNGTIPNLPNNGTIETIDKKIKALDELEPSTLKKYIKEVENEASSKEKEESPNNDDSLTKDMSDEELKEKINSIIDTEGFTNILGLESSRKMSKDDKQKIQDKKENIENNIPDNENSESKEKDELDKQIENMSDEDLEDLQDLSKEDLEDPDEIASTEDEKPKNESFISLSDFILLEKTEIESKSDLKALRKSSRQLKNRDLLSSFLRDNPASLIMSVIGRKRSNQQLALLQKRIDDTSDPEEKEKLSKQRETLKLTAFDSRGKYIGDPVSRKAREKQLLKDGKISKEDILSSDDRKQLRLDAKAFSNTDEGKKYVIDSKTELKKKKEEIKSGVEKMDKIENDVQKSRDKEEAKKEKERSKEEAKKEKEFQKEFEKEKRKEDRENKKNERRFKKEEKQKQKEEEKQKKEEEYQEWKKKKLAAQEEESDKEQDEVAKAEDGAEIHKRKKENGNGYTYVRIKNGKEVGYASEEDFQKAQQKKAKNESLLSDLNKFICESEMIRLSDNI